MLPLHRSSFKLNSIFLWLFCFLFFHVWLECVEKYMKKMYGKVWRWQTGQGFLLKQWSLRTELEKCKRRTETSNFYVFTWIIVIKGCTFYDSCLQTDRQTDKGFSRKRFEPRFLKLFLISFNDVSALLKKPEREKSLLMLQRVIYISCFPQNSSALLSSMLLYIGW